MTTLMIKVPYFEPWITTKDKKAVMISLSKRWLTNGPFLKKFEKKISTFLGTKFALGTSSATSSLHLSLRAIGIKPGDEVLVPTNTFAATENAVLYCGATPILVDVDLDTFNISIQDLKRKITRKTKAIIPVHYGGQSCDMKEIMSIAKKHELKIVEDCAHALGSTYGKKKCGSFGICGCFSFYPTKIITTGEGGMISTSNAIIVKKVKLLRSQGMSVSANTRESTGNWKYDIVDIGYNYRIDEMRCALGLSQMERIDTINKLRKKVAIKYDKSLSKIKGIICPITKHGRNHIYHLYSIRVFPEYHLSRNELFVKLHKLGIGCSVQYVPLHQMSYNKKRYQKNQKFPNANLIKNQVLCLPIFPTITEKQIQKVISALK